MRHNSQSTSQASSILSAVDFFCGGGGMTCGIKQAGIQVLAGLDNDKRCEGTYIRNHPEAAFICADITQAAVTTLSDIGIGPNDDNLIFIGCSPCQYWSVINTKREKSIKSRNLLTYFQKFVKYYKPGHVIIENVPGIKRKATQSNLNNFINFLSENGYSVDDGIINTNNYGVPQNRKRYVLVASRVNTHIKLPQPDNYRPVTKDFIGRKKGFKKIAAGHKDTTDFQHSTASLNDDNLRRLLLTPKNGGTRDAWKNNKDLQIPAYIGRDNCFKDVYGRMSWDKPAPTITTRFNSLSNGRFGHPEENRALSLREGATLQTFPKNYQFCSTSMATNVRIIGNAVPPEFAKRLGWAINSSTTNHKQEKL